MKQREHQNLLRWRTKDSSALFPANVAFLSMELLIKQLNKQAITYEPVVFTVIIMNRKRTFKKLYGQTAHTYFGSLVSFMSTAFCGQSTC